MDIRACALALLSTRNNTSMSAATEVEAAVIAAALEYAGWGVIEAQGARYEEGAVYALNALVRLDGVVWKSLVADNAGKPVAGPNWAISTAPAIAHDTDLNEGEWAVIKPLAALFVEREEAKMQELSRMASHEPGGRSVSEIESAIENFRNEYFRRWAFMFQPSTI